MEKKMTKNKLLYQKRKPDKETELLRMWTSKKGSKEAKQLDKMDKDAIDIKYKDMKVKICGFTTMTHKVTKKLIFAYKLKHEEKFVLYYIQDNKREGQRCLSFIQSFIEFGGYNLQNMEENLKSMYAEHGGKKK